MASLPTVLTTNRGAFIQKWAGFVSAIWLTIFSGYNMFPNYSSALKEVLGINQTLLNGLSNAIVVGESCFGIVAGILSNFLPGWALLCISASVGFLGHGITWLVVSKSISPLPYWLMLIIAVPSGSAGCWTIVMLMNAAVRNFKLNRGPVAGLFKACLGLSAAVFVAICDILFSNSASAYLLMLVIVPTLFSLISAVLFRPVSSAETIEEEKTERTSLRIFSGMACILALYIAALTLLPTDNLKESSIFKTIAMGLLIAITASPSLVPLVLLSKVKETEDLDNTLKVNTLKVNETEDVGYNHKEVGRSDEELGVDFDENISFSLDDHICPLPDQAISVDLEKVGLHQPLLENVTSSKSSSLQEKLQTNVAESRCYERSSSWSLWRIEDLGEDTPTLSLFKTWHYYVLYFSLLCGGGAVVTFSNNLGQVGQSFGFINANLFASLYSLGSFFGRLASGIVSEYFLRTTNIPRPAWMGWAKLPLPFLFIWLSTGSRTSLYIGSPLLGFSLGSLITLSVPIVSEFYGLKHFSTNVTLTNTYFLTGSLVFSTLTGFFYDRQALVGEGGNSLTCYGAECFSTAFQIMACCITIALVCDAILTFISRPLYKKLKSVNLTVVSNTNTNSCTKAS